MTDPRVAGDLTRRALLGGAAAVGAVSLTARTDALAAALTGHSGMSQRWVGSLRGESAGLSAPGRFALVGVQWAGPAQARIELRSRAREGEWGRWALASILGHEPDRGPRAAADPGTAASDLGTADPGGARLTADADRATAGGSEALFGEAIWTGPADWIQLRADRLVHGVRLHFVSATLPGTGIAAAALPLARPVLDAGPGQPPIISRAAWAQGHAPPRVLPAYGAIKLAFVHHTDTPNGYSRAEVPAMLQSMYRFHRFVRGWNDIGYNFAIDLFGRIWEARAGGIDKAVIGAQAGAYNTVSTGVGVLGTFQDVVPSPAAIGALERLLAWKLSLHGIPVKGHVTVEVDPADASFTPYAPGAHVSLPRVAGHRDGDLTGCPGDAFYARLPSIRSRVRALAAKPAKITLTAHPAVVAAGAEVTLSGRLRALAGAPIAGAPVELQEVTPKGAKTLADATTAADGTWTATLVPPTSIVVRALHRPAPATVSDVVLVGVAPTLTLTVGSVSPLRVSGTVSPARGQVTIDLYTHGSGRRRLLASKRVTARHGRFAARINTRHHGPSLLIASAAPSARYAAGSSPPVALTL